MWNKTQTLRFIALSIHVLLCCVIFLFFQKNFLPTESPKYIASNCHENLIKILGFNKEEKQKM